MKLSEIRVGDTIRAVKKVVDGTCTYEILVSSVFETVKGSYVVNNTYTFDARDVDVELVSRGMGFHVEDVDYIDVKSPEYFYVFVRVGDSWFQYSKQVGSGHSYFPLDVSLTDDEVEDELEAFLGDETVEVVGRALEEPARRCGVSVSDLF